jgi:sodium/potassium-transporting ATPase subunit alpha
VPVLLVDCVSVAVAFIPEGLPVCVTLSLTVIAGAMRKSNILCKSLSTVESLGAVSIICSDKTGTLTQNKMTVVNVAIGRTRYTASEARTRAAQGGPEGDGVKTIAAIAGLCNDAVFETTDHEQPPEIRRVNGDATDTGLLRFSEGVTPVDVIRKLWKEVGKIAFNSKNKFAVKLFRLKSNSGTLPLPLSLVDSFEPLDHLLLVKGVRMTTPLSALRPDI